jgi:hypothetical protein
VEATLGVKGHPLHTTSATTGCGNLGLESLFIFFFYYNVEILIISSYICDEK